MGWVPAISVAEVSGRHVMHNRLGELLGYLRDLSKSCLQLVA